MSDVDNNWADPTPEDPPKRRRSDSWGVRREVKRLIPYVGHLIMAVLLFLTAKLADGAQDTADDAAAKGKAGAQLAAKVKVENQAAYDVTKDKAVSMADDLKKLADRVNALEAELERLRSKAGKPRRRRAPITLSPETTAPPPPTPAAAAKEQAQE